MRDGCGNAPAAVFAFIRFLIGGKRASGHIFACDKNVLTYEKT